MRFEFNDDSQKICNSVDVVNYGIQCDICGNKVLSVSNINGKRYCAGCYYKTFMKDNQKAEIDQLKQQLAEKDKEIKKLRFDTQRYANDYREMALTRQIGMEHLAINELEKAKALLFSKAIQITGTGVDCVRLYEINKIINQQIKELKGEKDVED